eukprot:15476575-Alexandrium_andersonii.AAC.1
MGLPIHIGRRLTTNCRPPKSLKPAVAASSSFGPVSVTSKPWIRAPRSAGEAPNHASYGIRRPAGCRFKRSSLLLLELH